MNNKIISGALFDFMGWLTTRPKRIMLSSVDDASPAADAIKDFAKMRGLSLDDARVKDWQEALAEQPAQQERPSFAEWTSDYVRDNLHKLKPAQHPKAKAIAECLAVLRPSVKGKFPHEQALEELVGYIAAPQPAKQQEPVAWRVKVETKLRDGSVDFGYQLRNERLSKYDEPLYTSPQAQRKPLTDEEIMKVWQPVAKRMYGIVAEGHSMDVLGIRNESMVLSLSRAIEAAHGIKENT